MANIGYMWQTIIAIQFLVDEMKQELAKLEQDDLGNTTISTVLGYRRRKLSDTAENISQLTEGLMRDMRELWEN